MLVFHRNYAVFSELPCFFCWCAKHHKNSSQLVEITFAGQEWQPVKKKQERNNKDK